MIEIKAPGELDRIEFETIADSDQQGRLGSHYLADFYGCAAMPTTAPELQEMMLEAANLIGATVVTSSFHEFSPHGLSGVVVIAESHLAIHTWPENGVACIDLFTCSSDMDPRPGLKMLFQKFGAVSMNLTHCIRGRNSIQESRE